MANLVLKNNTSGGKTSVTADNFVGNASTASKWLTARTITIGNTGKSVNGSGNVSWSLSEIGAFAIYQCDSKGCGSSFPGSPILGQIFYKI